MSKRVECKGCGMCCFVGIFEEGTEMRELDRGDGFCMHLNDDNTCCRYDHRPWFCNSREMYRKVYSAVMDRRKFARLTRKACKTLRELQNGVDRSNNTKSGTHK